MNKGAKTENGSVKKQKITIKRLEESGEGCCQYDSCKKHKRGDSTHSLTHAVKREGVVVAMCCSRECAEGLKEVIEGEPPVCIVICLEGRSRNGVGPRNGAPPKKPLTMIHNALPPGRHRLRPLLKNGRVKSC